MPIVYYNREMIKRLQNEFEEISDALANREYSSIDPDILAVYMRQDKGVEDITEWFCIFRGKE